MRLRNLFVSSNTLEPLMKVAFTTLGCRTNQQDTAEMATVLAGEGFSIVGLSVTMTPLVERQKPTAQAVTRNETPQI